MTKDGSFKKIVQRHAQDTAERYTEALTDLEGLEVRLFHEPTARRLLANLRSLRHRRRRCDEAAARVPRPDPIPDDRGSGPKTNRVPTLL
jgi:hypothetical protein